MIKYAGIIGILVGAIAFYFWIRVKLRARKEKQAKEVFHFSPAQTKELHELADKYFISSQNIFYLAKILTYNQDLKGEKIPLSNDLVIALRNLSFEEYKGLTERYKASLKEAEKIKRKDNCPRKYLINYVNGDLIFASINELLLADFDPKNLGELWRNQANSAYLKVLEEKKKEKERFEKRRNASAGDLKTEWWDDLSSKDSSDSFDGFGGSSGGGGGNSSW